MTQLFAGDEQVGGHHDRHYDRGDDRHPDRHSDRQPVARPMIRQRPPVEDTTTGQGVGGFGPALTAGKGVRAVRCIGCSEPTLPRTDDNAPLCARCTDLLDDAQPRSSSLFSGRWRRRR